MTQVIRASISFEYYPEEDELMSDLTEEERLEYVRETVADDIRQMGYEWPMLENSIEIEVVDE